MENKQSVLIEAQIHDTQARLTEIQARVVAIDEQLKALTTADDFDPNSKDIRRLMDEQNRLSQELKMTGFRIDSLKQKHADAIRDEIKARLAEVVQLIPAIVAGVSKTAHQWTQGIEKLMGLLKECHTHTQHYAELTAEARYLAQVLEVDSPSFSFLPTLDAFDLTRLTEELAAATRLPLSRWEEKRHDLVEQRKQAATQQEPLRLSARVEYDPNLLQREIDARNQRLRGH